MRSATKNRIGRDAAYVAFIRSQPCCVCLRWKMKQTTRTEVAHIGLRGLSQKSPDRETIALCSLHHRTGSTSHHRLGVRFFRFHGLNREIMVAHYQDSFKQDDGKGPWWDA
jgi:hypothetical protein